MAWIKSHLSLTPDEIALLAAYASCLVQTRSAERPSSLLPEKELLLGVNEKKFRHLPERPYLGPVRQVDLSKKGETYWGGARNLADSWVFLEVRDSWFIDRHGKNLAEKCDFFEAVGVVPSEPELAGAYVWLTARLGCMERKENKEKIRFIQRRVTPFVAYANFRFAKSIVSSGHSLEFVCQQWLRATYVNPSRTLMFTNLVMGAA